MALNLNDGIDLSQLSRPRTTSTGAHQCTVAGGCDFLLAATLDPHNTVQDCLALAKDYVSMYYEAETAMVTLQSAQQQLADLFEQLRIANRALITANTSLAEEKDRLAGELRALRKKNPEDAKAALMEAAGNLVAAVKPVRSEDK